MKSSRVAATALLALGLAGCGSDPSSHPSTTTRRAGGTTTVTAATTTSTTASSTSTAPPTTAVPASHYVPLFPFGSLQEVAAWQAADGAVHQPWRLDAGQTALAFTRFLGFTEVDRVISSSTDTTGAHVAVGFATEGTHTATAAVVHLVRFGSGASIPWEVVGTDDADFTLETPRYGATITSPVSVGGQITGVDESITVRVGQLHANGYLGEQCCVMAGGEHSSWSTSVSFAPPNDPVLIISASTGGHIQGVERFAVTGVRRG